MFKHTGIVRRIDDIGRIVIPKEVRRRFRLHDGDPIEIGESENMIALRNTVYLSCLPKQIKG